MSVQPWLAWLDTRPPMGVPLSDAEAIRLREEIERRERGGGHHPVRIEGGGTIDPDSVVCLAPSSRRMQLVGGAGRTVL